MARCSFFLLLALVLEPLQIEAQEAEETSQIDVIDDTESTFVLTKDICLNAHKSAYLGGLCCDYFISFDEDHEFCSQNVQHYDDEAKELKEYSKYTECLFERKNYVKDSEHLNFDQIEADAAKLGDPLKEKFMVEMYKSAGHEASLLFKSAMRKPKSRLEYMQIHKPYFVFVNSCVVMYSSAHQCPYFRYGSSDDDDSAKCRNYTQKCEELLKE